MAWQWIKKVFEEERQTKGSERLVLLALADFANKQGYCYPSIGKLAERCNLTPRFVARLLDDLTNKGIISKHYRHNQTCEYWIVFQPDMNPSSSPDMNPSTPPEPPFMPDMNPSSYEDMNPSSYKQEENNQLTKGIPTAADLERAWRGITSFPTFLGSSRAEDMARLEGLYHVHGEGTAEYCKPFYEDWIGRGYSRTNSAWLDWAVAGQAPKSKNGRNGQVIHEKGGVHV